MEICENAVFLRSREQAGVNNDDVTVLDALSFIQGFFRT